MNDKQYAKMSDTAKRSYRRYKNQIKLDACEESQTQNWQTEHKAYDIGKPSNRVKAQIAKAQANRNGSSA